MAAEILGPEILGPEILGPEILGPEILGHGAADWPWIVRSL